MRRFSSLALVVVLSALPLSGCGASEDADALGSGGGRSGAAGSSAAGGAGGSSGIGGAAGSSGSSGTGGVPPLACGDAGTPAPAGFQVAPNGTPSGDGSGAKPWDLATALLGPASVKPGDTIFLRGGSYVGGFVAKLVGSAAAPITVRSYPGEWAVIDGRGTADPVLQIYKQWSVFRDLEITNSDALRDAASRPSGIYVEAANVKLVNLVIHDVGTGVIANSASASNPELAPELELYGSIFFANGWNEADRAHGHHVYLQNRDGTKHILDNVLGYAFGFGVHAYSDTDTYFTQGYEIAGNVWFQNGAAAQGAGSKLYDGCLVGHNGTHPAARVVLRQNFGWASGPGERDIRIGWAAPLNEDATLEGNYVVGQTIFQGAWSSVTLKNNTFYGDLVGLDAAQYPDNSYLAQRPSANHVVIRPNRYQPGRAHVIVYNWQGLDAVEIDPSGVLAPGARYEVRSAQNYLAEPVARGTWQGGTITLPMTGLSVAQPIGAPGSITPDETPGKDFAVFVLNGEC